MTFTWFEHGIEKGCVRKEFFYIRKSRKDYRLEVKEEENAVKCFDEGVNRLSPRFVGLRNHHPNRLKVPTLSDLHL